MSERNSLVIFTHGAKLLAEANTIQKAKELKNLALTAAEWAKRKKLGKDTVQYCRGYALEAERKIGELLKKTAKAKGGQPHQKKSTGHHSGPVEKTLEEMGVTKQESMEAQALADMPEPIFEDIKAGKVTRAEAVRQKKREENEELLEEIRQRPTSTPQGTYACLVVDPPWPVRKIEREERPNQTGFDYPTMTEDELAAFPISTYAADDAHLYLWTTHKFLPAALRLSEAWGFTYQCLLTWVKNVGFTPYSWMYSTEHILFCTRGSLPLLVLGKRLDFTAKVREHSRKPDVFYDLVQTVSPGPWLDVFSREARPGFAQLGNEEEKFDGRLAS